MRRFGALTLTALLTGALLVGVSPSATAVVGAAVQGGPGDGSGRDAHGDPDRVPGVGSVTWGACVDPTLVRFGAECAMLSVPLDYSKPHGTKIQLAISRVKHTVPANKYQGIMLINPGGPGGSGLIYSIFSNFVPDGAGAAYDWIGFDPRGVGSSVPALSCIPDYSVGPRPSYEPVTRAVEAAWIQRSKSYAKACGTNGGALLNHVKTIDNVRDMNAIRSALGRKQINYYGFSYGTYLGQVFATTYPDRVRRMVLDANVDPRRVWYQANLDQDVAFEKVITLFFDWVARHDSTYGLGTTEAAVERTYYAAQDALRAAPRGALGSAEWSDAFILAGYVQGAWPDVADAFTAFVNHDDAGPATALYEDSDGPGEDNSFAMYTATECSEGVWPRDWATWHRDNTRIARQAPYLTWNNAWFNAPCSFWPVRSGTPVQVKGKDLPRFLLLSETLDAATPFTGSLEVRKRFPSASLIATEDGTTHANSLNGNACVDDPIVAYLQDGTTPKRLKGKGPDVTCAASPEPEPATASAQSRTSSTAAVLDELRLGIARANR